MAPAPRGRPYTAGRSPARSFLPFFHLTRIVQTVKMGAPEKGLLGEARRCRTVQAWRSALFSAVFAAAISALVTAAAAQTVSPPEILGPWIGPGAPRTQPDLALYGTDLGWTFEHDGTLHMLFGDTWPHVASVCDPPPSHDDSQASLPLAPPQAGELPPVTFRTQPDAPGEFDRIRLERDGASLPLSFGQVPIAGFSDGRDAVALFNRGEPVRCESAEDGEPSCRPPRGRHFERLDHALGGGLHCSEAVGECSPPFLGLTLLCDLESGEGCPVGVCQPSPTGFCVDPTSSQNDGTSSSERFTIAQTNDFAIQDTERATHYRSVATHRTNKFINSTVRTVRRLRFGPGGSDYSPGHGALLVWGRPGYTGEQGRQAQLYLMMHPLPIRTDRHGEWRFRPYFFAGVHPASGRPRWTRLESRAAPLALDGAVAGDPHERLPIVDQMAISWVGAPIRRWVMLYGGDLDDLFLADPENARPGPAPGAIQIRFAKHPWGPWSPPQPHLVPGDPSVEGDPYGPGGVLYHPACQDLPGAPCAPTDPHRPVHAFLPNCQPFGFFEPGTFYAPNIIDAYTRPDGAGGVDIYWNVSTWNPYAVVLVRTNLRPDDESDDHPGGPRWKQRRRLRRHHAHP